jgi:hypothetical protein
MIQMKHLNNTDSGSQNIAMQVVSSATYQEDKSNSGRLSHADEGHGVGQQSHAGGFEAYPSGIQYTKKFK